MAREEIHAAPASYRDLIRQQSVAEPVMETRDQNLAAGVGAGLAAALLAAVLWAALTVATGYNYAIAAAGVGLLVGLAVRVAGNGSEPVFSLAGALLALLGCALGNVLAACAAFAGAESLPVLDVVSRLTPSVAWAILLATASPFDLIIFGVAAYEGYKLSVN